jgi:protein arginine kinase activator
MKCDRCDQEATVHLTQVLNGQMQKMHLCASCAEELGVSQGGGFSVSDVLLGQGVAAPASSSGSKNSSCPECGMTLARFRKTGRLGCPACWTAFERELGPLLQSMHHATTHTGRSPRHRESNLTQRQQEEELESQLAEAVASEDYEEAARLRDALKQLHNVGNHTP